MNLQQHPFLFLYSGLALLVKNNQSNQIKRKQNVGRQQRHFIYLLQANGIGLGFTVLTQVELLVKLLGQVTMTALSK